MPICLDDLKNFTNYSGRYKVLYFLVYVFSANSEKFHSNFTPSLSSSGGYSATHPVIQIFWEVVEGFTDDEKRKLLKFVTSCSRPPLLGFKVMWTPPPLLLSALALPTIILWFSILNRRECSLFNRLVMKMPRLITALKTIVFKLVLSPRPLLFYSS